MAPQEHFEEVFDLKDQLRLVFERKYKRLILNTLCKSFFKVLERDKRFNIFKGFFIRKMFTFRTEHLENCIKIELSFLKNRRYIFLGKDSICDFSDDDIFTKKIKDIESSIEKHTSELCDDTTFVGRLSMFFFVLIKGLK